MKTNYKISASLRAVAALLLAFICNTNYESFGGAIYYVATNGLDSYTPAQATSPLTPWKTINKAAGIAASGDTVEIFGGIYRETATVLNSGTAASPITFRPHPGDTVTVSGSDPVTSWRSHFSNIYYTTNTLTLTLGDENQVFKDGLMKPLVRWPNPGATYPWQDSSNNPSSDWAYVSTAGYNNITFSNNWMVCSNLPDRPDNYWNGATLNVMSGYGWIMDTPTVTAYTNSTKTLWTDDAHGNVAAYAITPGNEFYLSGVSGVSGTTSAVTNDLDADGEWYYTNGVLNIYTVHGVSNIEVKTRTNGFVVNGRGYITITNLNFFACTIQTDGNSTNNIYDNITMKYVTHSQKPTPGSRLQLRSGDVLRNSDIGFASSSMIFLGGNDIRVINNNLHDAGYVPYDPLISSSAIYQRDLISHNTIHDAGRTLIQNACSGMVMEYNDIYAGMRLATDGGAVYDNSNAAQAIFHHNVVHDIYGPTGHGGFGVVGLYLDSLTSDWIITHNIFYNITNSVASFCVKINSRFNYDFIFNNTCANSSGSINNTGNQDGEAGMNVYNNVFSVQPQPAANTGNWLAMDMRFNLYTNAMFATNGYPFPLSAVSPAIDQGVIIPGVTDGFKNSAPDLGALEYGGSNWTAQVGCNTNTPPTPDPAYTNYNPVFANKVIDGSFESGQFSPNWSTNGSLLIINSNAWTTAQEADSRSGTHSLSCGSGTPQVTQTLTNLLAGFRYKLYVGMLTSNTAATVTIGVTNYGNPVREITVSPTNYWLMTNLAFVTGSNNTSAGIYVKVASASTAQPVYIDDVGVILKTEPPDAQPRIPMVHYKLDDVNSLVAIDSSGNGLNGVLTNGSATDWTNGILNGGLHLNGTNYLLTPNIIAPTGSLTIACWAKSDVNTNWNAWGCFISKRPAFFLGPDKGSTQVRFTFYDTNGVVISNLGWDLHDTNAIAQWHHYAGVIDQSNHVASFYVDGALILSYNNLPTVGIDTNQFYIGKDHLAGNDRNFLGRIDDVWICNYAMSASDIQNLMSTNQSMMMHLTMDDGTGASFAYDSSGNGNNGMLTNMDANAVWTNGILNGAINFNGSNDWVLTPPAQTPASITVSCWAKSNTNTWNDYGCLVSRRPDFMLSSEKGKRDVWFYVFYDASGTNEAIATWSVPTNSNFDITQWHNYAGVFDASSSNASIYVDGYLVGTNHATKLMYQDVGQIYIGKDTFTGGNRNLNGVIDEVRIYPRALQWYELLDLAYSTGNPPYFGVTNVTGLSGYGPLVAIKPPAIVLPSSVYLTAGLDQSGRPTISFFRERGDLTYTLESTTNCFGQWDAVATNPGTVGSTVTVTNTTPSDAKARFYRLKLTAP